MCASPRKTTVEVKAGRNPPVPNVIPLEDLLRRMQQRATRSARGVPEATAALAPAKRLVADLEAGLRALRAQGASKPPRKR